MQEEILAKKEDEKSAADKIDKQERKFLLLEENNAALQRNLAKMKEEKESWKEEKKRMKERIKMLEVKRLKEHKTTVNSMSTSASRKKPPPVPVGFMAKKMTSEADQTQTI